jgi:hypothetical protein
MERKMFHLYGFMGLVLFSYFLKLILNAAMSLSRGEPANTRLICALVVQICDE